MPTWLKRMGGKLQTVQSGGKLELESGAEIDLKTGARLGLDGTDIRPKLVLMPTGVEAGYKIARGQHTTVDADDTVVTGLATVVAVVASLDDDPVDGAMFVTASIGDQGTTPAAGSVLIKTWINTDADATLIPATTFTKKVNWIAIGT